MSELYQLLTAQLQAIHEPHFKYYQLLNRFEITLCFVKENAQVPVHTHDQTVVNYVMEGSVRISMNKSNQVFEKGQLISISAGIEHDLSSEKGAVLLEFWEK